MSKNEDKALNKEIANSITHAIGLVFFLVANPILILYTFKNGTYGNVMAATIFSFTLIFTYLSSTLYHSMQEPKTKYVLRIFDHISIFFLIGGSYTALIQFYLWDERGKILMSIMWTLILGGTILKIFFTGKYDFVSTVFYILLGCIAIIYIRTLQELMSPIVFKLLIIGGLSYLFGVIFYAWKRYTYHHAVWHLFVAAGSVCHFLAITISAVEYLGNPN